jgi:hypothetical protein
LWSRKLLSLSNFEAILKFKLVDLASDCLKHFLTLLNNYGMGSHLSSHECPSEPEKLLKPFEANVLTLLLNI